MSLLKRIKKAIREEHSQTVQRGIVIYTNAENIAYWEKVIEDAYQLAKEKKNKKGS